MRKLLVSSLVLALFATLSLTGGVLACGADKAGIVWRGREFRWHVASRLADCTVRTVFVVREDQRGLEWPGDGVVCDDPSLPEGPMRGIIAGLDTVSEGLATIAAVDCPMVDPRLYQAMASILSAATSVW